VGAHAQVADTSAKHGLFLQKQLNIFEVAPSFFYLYSDNGCCSMFLPREAGSFLCFPGAMSLYVNKKEP